MSCANEFAIVCCHPLCRSNLFFSSYRQVFLPKMGGGNLFRERCERLFVHWKSKRKISLQRLSQQSSFSVEAFIEDLTYSTYSSIYIPFLSSTSLFLRTKRNLGHDEPTQKSVALFKIYPAWTGGGGEQQSRAEGGRGVKPGLLRWRGGCFFGLRAKKGSLLGWGSGMESDLEGGSRPPQSTRMGSKCKTNWGSPGIG